MAAGLAVLAGLGWDRVTQEEAQSRRLRRLGLAGLMISLVGLVCAWAARGTALAYLTPAISDPHVFGPAAIAGALQRLSGPWPTEWSSSPQSWPWANCIRRRPRGAALLAMMLMSADLSVANARLVWTAPQATFYCAVRGGRQIEASERFDPSPGPFRVHRMPGGWFPVQFGTTGNPRRYAELMSWARETLFPLFAPPLGFEYSTTIGSLELEDYGAFFHPRPMPLPAGIATILGVPAGQPVVYFPRRSFDLWAARYFLLPALPDWANRIAASPRSWTRPNWFTLARCALRSAGPGRAGAVESAPGLGSFAATSRLSGAWVVHPCTGSALARLRPGYPRSADEITDLHERSDLERARPIGFDLRQMAMIETTTRRVSEEFHLPHSRWASESVVVVRYEPQRVELLASLERPGLVILADTYYPGWRLTIDGKPAPIFVPIA